MRGGLVQWCRHGGGDPFSQPAVTGPYLPRWRHDQPSCVRAGCPRRAGRRGPWCGSLHPGRDP
ncbi:hypothetical protein AB852_28695 [Streptomyces uncialis]|uniref:Uncharacterized protein n=1 Tax=Streptomyces uncialis TaxID=1048205 RepID=A0A1Q4V1N3_9ACTN|nr:hypothetical protein AB852_28695 [Streptomyces uncialis]